MIKQKAAKDRTIVKFPPPFNLSATPYEKIDFDVPVKETCISNKSITAGLKIAKVIVVGNVSVGKTSLVNRFCHQVFDRDYKATIGVDFEVERFDILQIPFNLQIWDTAGQERFKCIASAYYRGAHAIVVVFDLTDLRSLHCCPRWLEEASSDNKNDPLVFLVGTKKDLCMDSVYQAVEKHATGVAKNMNAEYWAVSSKSGEKVQEFYCRLAALAFNESVLREAEKPTRVKLGSDLVKLDNRTSIIERKSRIKCHGCKA